MWLLTVFVLYLLGLAAIGIYCARMNRTLADFVLGVRGESGHRRGSAPSRE
jgi:Na+/proline symporter